MFTIRLENDSDDDAVAALRTAAFGAGHAARNIRTLRTGERVAELCHVAVSDEGDTPRLTASIRYWPITVAGIDSLLLGPLAVDPAMRGQGIGKALVRQSLARAHAIGDWRFCFISGEPHYYLEFGFTKISAEDVILPAPIEDERLHMLDFTSPGFHLGGGDELPPRPWQIKGV